MDTSVYYENIISPTKSLNFEATLPTKQFSEALFLNEAERINKLLKKKSVRSIGKLMNISENLSALNWQHNQDFQLPFSPENARPAVYAFDGDVTRTRPSERGTTPLLEKCEFSLDFMVC